MKNLYDCKLFSNIGTQVVFVLYFGGRYACSGLQERIRTVGARDDEVSTQSCRIPQQLKCSMFFIVKLSKTAMTKCAAILPCVKNYLRCSHKIKIYQIASKASLPPSPSKPSHKASQKWCTLFLSTLAADHNFQDCMPLLMLLLIS